MRTLLLATLPVCTLAGCIATAPVSVAWRSNTSQQHAATDGRNQKDADANTVNADKSTDAQATVTKNTREKE